MRQNQYTSIEYLCSPNRFYVFDLPFVARSGELCRRLGTTSTLDYALPPVAVGAASGVK